MTGTFTDAKARLAGYIDELTQIFKSTRDKREAHQKSRSILEGMSHDPLFLTAVLQKHLTTPGALNTRHYPVLAMDVTLNAYYGMVVNCWVPLPDRNTNVTTKSIHHHGNMLLSTVTVFGPGYEHWTFKPLRHAEDEGISLELIDHKMHPLHHVAFVDSYVAHVPFYPSSLTMTVALWTNQSPTTWKDRVKRLPVLKGKEAIFRNIGLRLGLTNLFDLKEIKDFDFCPTNDGFKVLKEREEFKRGPNENYLYSLFHIIQKTGNEKLVAVIQQQLDSGKVDFQSRQIVEQLVQDVLKGKPIEGRLSEGHFGIPTANFTKQDIERALTSQKLAGHKIIQK